MIKGIIILLLIFAYMIYKGFAGKKKVERLQEDVKTVPIARIKFYKGSLKRTWIRTVIIVLIGIFIMGMGLKEFGLSFPTINTESLGWFSYVIIVLLVLYSALMIYVWIDERIVKGKRYFVPQNLVNETESYRVVLPETEAESRIWNFTAFTAGFTEELIFRAFLMYLIVSLFEGMPLFFVALITALVFGFGHFYQGVNGVITTGTVGLIFACGYIILESIIPLILLHWLIDYNVKFTRLKSPNKEFTQANVKIN